MCRECGRRSLARSPGRVLRSRRPFYLSHTLWSLCPPSTHHWRTARGAHRVSIYKDSFESSLSHVPPQAPHAPLAARACTSRGLVAAQDGRLDRRAVRHRLGQKVLRFLLKALKVPSSRSMPTASTAQILGNTVHGRALNESKATATTTTRRRRLRVYSLNSYSVQRRSKRS